MKNAKFSTRDFAMLAFIVVLLLGILYYMMFYKPLQADLASLATQSSQLSDQIDAATAKVGRKKTMQDELSVILSQPKFQITEIAPYDNKDVVLNMLNGILGRSDNYSLSFADPAIGQDGTVRRTVNMSFKCESYEAAKVILRDLTNSKWRCMVNNCTITADGSEAREEKVILVESHQEGEVVEEEEKDAELNIMQNGISVATTITFFESTKLAK